MPTLTAHSQAENPQQPRVGHVHAAAPQATSSITAVMYRRRRDDDGPFDEQGLPPVDRHRLALAPARPQVGGGVTEGGVHDRVHDRGAEESAHERQQRDVERVQPQPRVVRQRAILHDRHCDRVGQQQTGGGRLRVRPGPTAPDARRIWRDATASAGCKIPVASEVPTVPALLIDDDLHPRGGDGSAGTTAGTGGGTGGGRVQACRLSRLSVRPGGITSVAYRPSRSIACSASERVSTSRWSRLRHRRGGEAGRP